MNPRSESGYALLLVFAMAAAVSIMLYMELPRLVFESRRITEQELVDRGEQYQRAIQLYVRKFKKYPASIEELETASNIRFLRRRYKDPMTGEEEWRLIHIDAAGAYTDSLIHKPPEDEKEKKSENTFITEGAAFGSTGPAPGDTQGQKSGTLVRGASDRPAVEAGGGQFAGVPGEGQQPYLPGALPAQGAPGAVPGQAGAYGQQQPYPGQPDPNLPVGLAPYLTPGQPIPPYQQQQPRPPQPNPSVQVGLGQYVVPGQLPANPRQQSGQQQQYQYPRQGIPGLPGPYGRSQQQPTTPQYPGYSASPSAPRTGVPRQPPAQPGASTGMTAPGQGSSAAMDLIRNLLTTPRPGGLRGIQAGAGGQAQTIGGGIAGVASTLEAEGIMVYNERTKYNEWEFLYDYTQEMSARGAAAARGAGVGGARNPLGQSQSQPSSFGGAKQSHPFSPTPMQPPPPPLGRTR